MIHELDLLQDSGEDGCVHVRTGMCSRDVLMFINRHRIHKGKQNFSEHFHSQAELFTKRGVRAQTMVLPR